MLGALLLVGAAAVIEKQVYVIATTDAVAAASRAVCDSGPCRDPLTVQAVRAGNSSNLVEAMRRLREQRRPLSAARLVVLGESMVATLASVGAMLDPSAPSVFLAAVVQVGLDEEELRACRERTWWPSEASLVTPFCYSFASEEAIFVAGAGAALLPWSQAFAMFTDDTSAAENDQSFQAFTHGIKYVDPTATVLRVQLTSDAPLESELLTLAIKAEVRKLLQHASIIYLDLRNSWSVSMALEAVQAHQESTSGSAFAIVPPNFEAFDSQGVPHAEWKTAVLNAIAFDLARGVRVALGERQRTATHEWELEDEDRARRRIKEYVKEQRAQKQGVWYFSLEDGFAGTMWTRDPLAGLWLNESIGVLGATPYIERLTSRPCGEETVQEFLQESIAAKLHVQRDPSDEWQCHATVQCCNPERQPDLARLEYLPLQCGVEDCGDLDVTAEEHPCGEVIATAHGCPVRADSTMRRVAVGLTVMNIADIDTSKGQFYVDFHVHMYEDNAQLTEEEVWPEKCELAGLEHSMNFTDINHFHSLFSLGATHQWMVLTPAVRSGGDQIINGKGNAFFRTDLDLWPFDQQHLTIDVDMRAPRTESRFCILPQFSALSPDIRLAGIKTEDMFDVLKLETSIRDVCSPPFKYPTHNRCDVYVPGTELCMKCADPTREVAGPPADITCKCMGGSRPSSRASFSIVFTRPVGRLTISIFLPPVAIMLLNQAVLFIRLDDGSARLSMCASALLSSVMYHVTIMANSPTTAQESTKADSFMMLCYCVNVAIWVMVLVQYIASRSTDPVRRQWADSLFFKGQVGCPLLSFAGGLSVLLVKSTLWGLCIIMVLGAMGMIALITDLRRFTGGSMSPRAVFADFRDWRSNLPPFSRELELTPSMMAARAGRTTPSHLRQGQGQSLLDRMDRLDRMERKQSPLTQKEADQIVFT
jgi:hypothetical protein